MNLIALIFLACGSTTESTPTKEISIVQKEVQKKGVSPTGKVDSSKKSLNLEDVEKSILSPSPLELKGTAEKEGLTSNLATLVPVRNFVGDNKNTDHIALQIGVVLTDTVMQIDTLSKESLLKNLTQIESNLSKMGAGEGFVFSVTELKRKVTNDALNRDEVLLEMDEIIAYSRPSEGFGKDDTTGPLLQAGSWLTSLNLISHAILNEKKIASANTLFRHGKIAEYFLSYVQHEGGQKVDGSVKAVLEDTLNVLIEVSEKKEITKADVEQVASITDKLLALI